MNNKDPSSSQWAPSTGRAAASGIDLTPGAVVDNADLRGVPGHEQGAEAHAEEEEADGQRGGERLLPIQDELHGAHGLLCKGRAVGHVMPHAGRTWASGRSDVSDQARAKIGTSKIKRFLPACWQCWPTRSRMARRATS